MRQRILCPVHKEATPSMVLYDDVGHCFGCGATIPLDKLGVKAEQKEKYVEDIEASLKRIRELPKRDIRGFQLHCDPDYFYILFPGASYYKKRLIARTSGSKYVGPSGHQKPLFRAVDSPENNTLAIVEGELNAMSLAACGFPVNVCSPGGAGDFYSKSMSKELTYYARHARILIVTDKDKAGAVAAIELKARLLGRSHVMIQLVEKDFNELYQEPEGKEKIRMVVQPWLRSLEGGVQTPGSPASGL